MLYIYKTTLSNCTYRCFSVCVILHLAFFSSDTVLIHKWIHTYSVPQCKKKGDILEQQRKDVLFNSMPIGYPFEKKKKSTFTSASLNKLNSRYISGLNVGGKIIKPLEENIRNLHDLWGHKKY